VGIAHFNRKGLRRCRSNKAVEEGNNHTQADERVHVWRAIDDTQPAATVIVQRSPKHYRYRQHQFCTTQHSRTGFGDMQIQQVRQHRNADQRQRECERDPELHPHFADLAIVLLFDRHLRLERHAADRTVAWTELAHLRVHRTGVNGSGRNVLHIRFHFRAAFGISSNDS
jgi:hypothetical protein